MAKAFAFRLQTVLDLACRIQDEKAQALARVQAKHQSLLDRMERLGLEQAARRLELLDAQQSGALDLQSIQWGLDYIGLLALDMANQQEALASAEQEVESARAELLAAASKVQVLEKLKAKAKAEYQAKLDHAEAGFIDELSTMRFVRQGGLNFGD